jgi:hypothetical protein
MTRYTEVAKLMHGLWGDIVPLDPIDWSSVVENVLDLDDQLGRDAGIVVQADELPLLVLAELLDQVPDSDPLRRRLPSSLTDRVATERQLGVQRCWLDATNAVLERAVTDHHVLSGSVYLCEGDLCRLSAYINWRADLLRFWQWAPLSLDLPMMHAIRDRRPVWDRYSPSDSPADGDEELDLLALPLLVGDRRDSVGALVLTWQPGASARPDSEPQAGITALADQISELVTMWRPRPGPPSTSGICCHGG